MKVLSIFLFVFTTLLPGWAQDVQNSVTVPRIVALEKAWNQAYRQHDTKALSALLDAAILIVNDDGSLQSKGVFLASVHAAKASDEEQVTPESIFVQVSGDVAVASGVFRATGVHAGKHFLRRNRFADTWMEKNGVWVCISASATPMLH